MCTPALQRACQRVCVHVFECVYVYCVCVYKLGGFVAKPAAVATGPCEMGER